MKIHAHDAELTLRDATSDLEVNLRGDIELDVPSEPPGPVSAGPVWSLASERSMRVMEHAYTTWPPSPSPPSPLDPKPARILNRAQRRGRKG